MSKIRPSVAAHQAQHVGQVQAKCLAQQAIILLLPSLA
ncbi:hypothetical protein RGAI101_883 [Roseobacter sp. GAI101]|nr:hypothetical protein RGAI101_883 [Roseobacter sp. GAI101]